MLYRTVPLPGRAGGPNLVHLGPLTRQVDHDPGVLIFAGPADVTQQLDHRVLGYTSHSHSGPKYVAFDLRCYHPNAPGCSQSVHIDHYA